MTDPLLTALRDALGAEAVLTEAAAMAPHLTDWRKRYTGRARAVLRPGDTDQVARAARLCAEHDAPIVPQGGNTGLVGGGTPDASGRAVVLSLTRMNRVRQIDTANDTITVEAAASCSRCRKPHARRRLFPLSLAAEGSATIGGNLASNAGGTQVLRYGNARDLTLGLEVVLAGGSVWDGLRGLRKDNTGYDLKHLFIGAEGTLGIITAATLKLYPLPRAQLTALAALPSLAATLALLNRTRAGAGSALTGFEVMSAAVPAPGGARTATVAAAAGARCGARGSRCWNCRTARARHTPPRCSKRCLKLRSRPGETSDAVGGAVDRRVARAVGDSRGIPEAQARAGGNVKHDISLPVSCIPGFVEATNAALRARFAWIEPVVFGHLGDGNLHYNMAVQEGTAVAVAFAHEAEINRLVHDAVAAAGGSISAEHGLGQMKREEIRRYKSPLELELMRAIKQALVPRGLMNPGKLL